MKNRIVATFYEALGNVHLTDATGETCKDINGILLDNYAIQLGTDLTFYAYTLGGKLETSVTIEVVSGKYKGYFERSTDLENGDTIFFPSVWGRIENHRNFDDFVKDIKASAGIA